MLCLILTIHPEKNCIIFFYSILKYILELKHSFNTAKFLLYKDNEVNPFNPSLELITTIFKFHG
jgi:hypothetical protein